jgi:hypothetical protein
MNGKLVTNLPSREELLKLAQQDSFVLAKGKIITLHIAGIHLTVQSFSYDFPKYPDRVFKMDDSGINLMVKLTVSVKNLSDTQRSNLELALKRFEYAQLTSTNPYTGYAEHCNYQCSSLSSGLFDWELYGKVHFEYAYENEAAEEAFGANSNDLGIDIGVKKNGQSARSLNSGQF